MEQFSLEKWLKDKSRKVVTRNGNEAEIIHDKDPLVAIINDVAYNFDNDGKFQSNKAKHKYDLFFADEEENMNEFETRIYNLINLSDPYNYPSIKEVKEEAEILLDLANKEILKDLPKWKKAKENRTLPYGVVKIDKDGKIIYSDMVWEGEYFIMFQSLKSLPKEE